MTKYIPFIVSCACVFAMTYCIIQIVFDPNTLLDDKIFMGAMLSFANGFLINLAVTDWEYARSIK